MNLHQSKNFGRSICFFISILFLCACSQSGQPDQSEQSEQSDVLWAKQGGGDNYDGGRGIAIDTQGNVLVVGRFQGNAAFDGLTLAGKGDDGIFLLKYNAGGKLLWAKEAGGKKEDSGYSIDTDSQGNIYITGYFADTVFFGSHTMVSKGEYDAFLAKYDTDGNVLWVKQAGGILYDVGRGVRTDNSGNCYMTGFFTGTIFLDTIQLESDGFFEDIFIAKYNPEGKILWAKRAGGNRHDRAVQIATDKQGHFYIAGFFNETAAFDSIELISVGKSDLFVAGYDNNGNALWARQGGGSYDDEARGISADEQGNVYAAGFFYREMKFGLPDTPSATQLTGSGDRDVFVVKYDASGNLQWARQAGGSDLDEGSAVEALPSGGCFVTGYFGQQANFQDTVISPMGGYDIFWAHYTPDGNLSCLTQAGSNGYNEGRSIKFNDEGDIYLAGNYKGILHFGDTKLPESLGDGDMFVVKLLHECK